MTSAEPILQVAVPAPLMQLFDYLPPRGGPVAKAGQRIQVPFGRGRRIGVIVAVGRASTLPPERLRRALAIIDPQPILDAGLLDLLNWSSAYYQHPPGEVYSAALPAALRHGGPPASPPERWRASENATAERLQSLERRARLQHRILAAAIAAEGGVSRDDLDLSAESWRRGVRALADKELIVACQDRLWPAPRPDLARAGPTLNAEQRAAADAINATGDFAAFLLDGVTGSGKTEVYLACIAREIEQGRQSLVLVPEIGLTPQLVDRFQQRLGITVALLHSALGDRDRLRAWSAAQTGEAAVIIGTRSAVFTPLRDPGLIIVDEEHDASLKQQEGFRYSARDLAVWRANRLGIPVVLGSATPSFESIENARAGRYRRLLLTARPGGATHPRIELVDLRRQPARDGLTEPLRLAIARHLEAGGQVLLYLNRRGYSPVLMCTACGTVAECDSCDARMVYHRQRAQLACHHCGATRRAPAGCPDCSEPLVTVGQGTERLETALRELFPDHSMVRIDRDTTRQRGAVQRQLAAVRSGEARILIGTQMLAKGHDFPDVTLVAMIDADQGLFGTDFRAAERLAQSFVQVSGRAGRADRPGEVCIQTAYPEHPLLQTLLRAGYAGFAEQSLAERQSAGWPPFGFLALLRAEDRQRPSVFAFLDDARRLAAEAGVDGIDLLGPAPAPMERRQGRFRGQLLIRSGHRAHLHRLLQAWRPQLESVASGRRLRWSLDVDPIELF